MARPVRARRPASRDAAARRRRAATGGADRTGRSIRLRGQARFNRRTASGHARTASGPGLWSIGEGIEAGRSSRDRGTAAPRTRNARSQPIRVRGARGGDAGTRRHEGRGAKVRRGSQVQASSQVQVGSQVSERLGVLHPPADCHELTDGGDRVVWRDCVSCVAGQRSAAG